jgi:23S rRNA (adenine2030-N6)-methyltransferase
VYLDDIDRPAGKAARAEPLRAARMNYRHAFHAGGFADVFKHALVVRLLLHLRRKETAFRVIDTHAGRGLYRLDAEEARRTGEWREGIGRVLDATFEPSVAALLEPWLASVRRLASDPEPSYPGSPLLLQDLTRPQDRLTFCEKLAGEAAALRAALGRDRRAQVVEGDGWSILQGHLPPPERRGLVLIDPPFEEAREFSTIATALGAALRRWNRGIYAVWYPVKSRRDVESFIRKLSGLPAPRILRVEIGLYDVERVDRLNGCGLLVVNPPWHFDEEAISLASGLGRVLAREGNGTRRLDWLKSEA